MASRLRRRRQGLLAAALAAPAGAAAVALWASGPIGETAPDRSDGVLVAENEETDAETAAGPFAAVDWSRRLRSELFPTAEEPAPKPEAAAPPPPRTVSPPAATLLGTIAEGSDTLAVLRLGAGATAVVEVRRAGELLEGLPSVRVSAVSDGAAVLEVGGREFLLKTPYRRGPFVEGSSGNAGR